MKSQMKDFHNRMEGQQDYQHTSANTNETHKTKVKEGDYIDFEEIK